METLTVFLIALTVALGATAIGLGLFVIGSKQPTPLKPQKFA